MQERLPAWLSTPEDKLRFVAALKQRSYTEVGALFGVTRNTIAGLVFRHGGLEKFLKLLGDSTPTETVHALRAREHWRKSDVFANGRAVHREAQKQQRAERLERIAAQVPNRDNERARRISAALQGESERLVRASIESATKRPVHGGKIVATLAEAVQRRSSSVRIPGVLISWYSAYDKASSNGTPVLKPALRVTVLRTSLTVGTGLAGTIDTEVSGSLMQALNTESSELSRALRARGVEHVELHAETKHGTAVLVDKWLA